MRILYFLLGILVLFSSCVSTKKYTKYVHDQLKPDQFDTIARINFSYKGPTSVDSIKVTKLKSYFVPAIFYWGVRNKMLCEVNPELYAKYFEECFLKHSQELGLLEQLGDRRLDISLDYIPSSFIYDFQSQNIIFIVGYTTMTKEEIVPEAGLRPMKVQYAVQPKADADTIAGEIVIPDYQEPLLNIWKSTRGFTKKYINSLKSGLDEKAKDVAVQILETLE